MYLIECLVNHFPHDDLVMTLWWFPSKDKPSQSLNIQSVKCNQTNVTPKKSAISAAVFYWCANFSVPCYKWSSYTFWVLKMHQLDQPIQRTVLARRADELRKPSWYGAGFTWEHNPKLPASCPTREWHGLQIILGYFYSLKVTLILILFFLSIVLMCYITKWGDSDIKHDMK